MTRKGRNARIGLGSMKDGEDELFREILGGELFDEKEVEVRRAILRELISNGLGAEGRPPSLAKRMANIPEIVGRLTGEVQTARELAERFDDEKAMERLTEYLIAPIAVLIEKNSKSELERETMVEGGDSEAEGNPVVHGGETLEAVSASLCKGILKSRRIDTPLPIFQTRVVTCRERPHAS